jgi:hypothetical protein
MEAFGGAQSKLLSCGNGPIFWFRHCCAGYRSIRTRSFEGCGRFGTKTGWRLECALLTGSVEQWTDPKPGGAKDK